MSAGVRVVEVDPGVFCATGTHVNWVLIREGSDVTLVDSGYPGDAAAVVASLAQVGARPEDVRAILLTHAHIDHMGSLNHFHRRYGTPAYASAAETPHAHREFRHQATPMDVARNAWRPGVLGWSLRIARAGAARDAPAPHVTPFPRAGALDLPGRPVPIVTGGHTGGHTAYQLPSIGALITGDELATGHPTARLSGPQILPRMFNHCSGAESLAALEHLTPVDAGLLIPGHGAPTRRTPADAVAAARAALADPRYW